MGHQLIYTVARYGVKGQGHCIYSYDEHFPQERLRDISYYSKFRLPQTLNVADITNIAFENRILPSTFAYFYDGKYNFFSKRYLGKEYLNRDARPGNFLNHWVILDELMQHPIEKFRSPTFRTSMLVEEVDNIDIPAYLSDKFELLSGPITLNVVQEFIRLENRKELVSQLLSAVIDEQISSKKKTIVIVDEFDNIPLWIASILYSFPLSLSKKLSFSTFEYSPNESYVQSERFDIVGVIPEGTDFQSRNSMFFRLFDMKNRIFMNESVSKYRYSDWAVTALLENATDIENIDKLLTESFDYIEIDKNIDSILSYYEYISYQTSLDKFRDSMSVISEYGKTHTQFQFFEQLLESPILPSILSTNYRRDVIAHIRARNKKSQLSLFKDYVFLLQSSEKEGRYNPYLLNQLTDDFVSFDANIKVEILNTVKDIELFQELFSVYLSFDLDEALQSVKRLPVVRQRKVEPILLREPDKALLFIKRAIIDLWDPSLVHNLISLNVDKPPVTISNSLLTLIIDWYSTQEQFEVPVQLYLLHGKEEILVAESQKERLSILRRIMQKLQSQSLQQELLEQFCLDIIDIICKNIASSSDIEYFYKIVSPIYNIEKALLACIQNQIVNGDDELLLLFLQFEYKNRMLSEEQIESFVKQKNLKRSFEEMEKQIKQEKIQVSDKFYKYFMHLKKEHSDANKFKLFSIFGR